MCACVCVCSRFPARPGGRSQLEGRRSSWWSQHTQTCPSERRPTRCVMVRTCHEGGKQDEGTVGWLSMCMCARRDLDDKYGDQPTTPNPGQTTKRFIMRAYAEGFRKVLQVGTTPHRKKKGEEVGVEKRVSRKGSESEEEGGTAPILACLGMEGLCSSWDTASALAMPCKTPPRVSHL